MKKIILLVMTIVLLVSSAQAEDLSNKTDEELLTLYQQVSGELANRNLSPDEVYTPLKERLYEFMCLWSENDIAGMVKYCSSEWAAQQEDPAMSLFAILKNSRPLSYEYISVSGDPEASVRGAECKINIDWNTGKIPETYCMNVTMVLEEDGLWYIDPANLEWTYTAEPTLVPELTPAPPAEITGDTILYYDPEGGSKYHLDPYCKTVNPKLLPLQGTFRYSEVNDPQYQELRTCHICLAPERPSGDSGELSPSDYTQKAWAFTAELYAEILKNPESSTNQPFCVKGMVQEVVSENPLTVVINTSEDDTSLPVLIESPDADKIHWEKGCKYRIYGDFVSVKDNMPVLNARFSFTW